MSNITVVNNAADSRFEIQRNGDVVGHLDYRTQGNTVDLTHAETDNAVRGEGLGGRLVQGALDTIKTEKMSVIATCPFVSSWIEQHEEYQSLLAPRS
ncbi:MAG: GNAT family N-acetyltransferase [Ornithinimicrobium sp.]